MNIGRILFLVCIVISIFAFSGRKEQSEPYDIQETNIEIRLLEEMIEISSGAINIFGFVPVAFGLSVLWYVYKDYVKRLREDIFTKTIHELLKNIAQFPRGTIDKRTHVRYNNTIAILVRAVNGGAGNGRIQEINNRYGKFAYR